MWSQFPPNLSRVIWDLVGTGSTLFSGGLFWDQFLLDLIKNFFGARLRGKLMYYYFYHGFNLREIIQFLCKFECIEFECNKFLLVLVQMDLIRFEHSIGISSSWNKSITNPLHSMLIHTISRKIGDIIQIVAHHVVGKTISSFNLYLFN
jgi:hypothetical protein